MSEWRIAPAGDADEPPEICTATWYKDRDRAPHLEQPDHHPRMVEAANAVLHLLDTDPTLRTVADFGAGDGGMLSQLIGPLGTDRVWGYDLCPANVEAAQTERGIATVRLLDFTKGPRVRWPDVAIMTETLEHLHDPHGWLHRLAGHCRALVCSSPSDERPGTADPVHVWAWDEPGYFALLMNSGWTPQRHWRAGRYQLIAAVRT